MFFVGVHNFKNKQPGGGNNCRPTPDPSLKFLISSRYLCLDKLWKDRCNWFENADGRSSNEVHVGKWMISDCIDKCIEKQKKDASFNGATYNFKTWDCYCERRMTGTTKSSNYHTCYLPSECYLITGGEIWHGLLNLVRFRSPWIWGRGVEPEFHNIISVNRPFLIFRPIQSSLLLLIDSWIRRSTV